MNRLDSHRRHQRFCRVQRHVNEWVAAFGVGFVVLAFIVLVPWRAVSAASTGYGALVNILLTAALVIITAFYAFVTSATLSEMREGRAAASRPLVKIRLGHFIVRNEGGISGYLRLDGIATFANYGRGPAVDIRAYLSVPSTRGSDAETYTMSEIGDPILALEPGRPVELAVGSLVHQYSVSLPDKNFFEVDASFEDIEANLYQIKQFYNLHPLPGPEPDTQEWRCYLRFEDLTCIPFRRGNRGTLTQRPARSHSAERLLIERG
jgi:hypothetical protein